MMSHRQEPGGLMAVQRHHRGQGFLGEWEKAPNLDRVIWNEKLEQIFRIGEKKKKRTTKEGNGVHVDVRFWDSKILYTSIKNAETWCNSDKAKEMKLKHK